MTTKLPVVCVSSLVPRLAAVVRQLLPAAEILEATPGEDGVEALFRAFPTPPEGVTITRMGDGFGRLMAEYVVGNILSRELSIVKFSQQQQNNMWDKRTVGNLSEFLAGCDYICNVLPSTTETQDLLSGDALSCCKSKSPVFINVGRGGIISEESLLAALE
uniref:Glyoxylate/hydroxypyruvate reductase B n=1 Tax=Magallana gigas TaxID=29159 RepID=K1P6W5_MAGGI